MTTMTTSVREVNALGNRDHFAWVKEYGRRVRSLPRMEWLRKAAALAGLTPDALPESLLFRPWDAGYALSVRDAVVKAVIEATEPTPDTVPTYSDDAEFEAAVGAGLACLYPASDRYKANMAMLADMADRTAALLADDRAARKSDLFAPADDFATADLDVDGDDEAYAEREAWDAMCEAAAAFEAELAYAEMADPEWPTADEIADYEAHELSPAGDALPAISGGSPEADDDGFPDLDVWPYDVAYSDDREPEQQEMRGGGTGHPASEW